MIYTWVSRQLSTNSIDFELGRCIRLQQHITHAVFINGQMSQSYNLPYERGVEESDCLSNMLTCHKHSFQRTSYNKNHNLVFKIEI